MKPIAFYRNGNYEVKLFSDGTKIRETQEDEFIPDRMESCDCKVTQFCQGTGIDGNGCKFCHEKSGPDGKHANLNLPVIDTFLPYTEVAIGGGNPLSHPDLENFLVRLKELKCFPSMTVNQVHFEKELERLARYRDEELIYGLGISLMNPTEEFAKKVNEFPNAVIHVIAGLITKERLQTLSDLGVKKILILGYKQWGRGKDFYSESIEQKIVELKEAMKDVINMFEVVSFDNLAIKQLDIKSLMTQDEWDNFYMGDDGGYTMYIDLVNEQYAQSSTSEERFALKETINDMFLDIRRRKYERENSCD